LTPTIEASGPHDFTVRFGTARQHVLKIAHEPKKKPALPSHRAHDTAASTASRPNVRDDGQRPFLGDRMPGVLKVICPTTKAKICPSGYFVAATAGEGLEHMNSGWAAVCFAMHPELKSDVA
jgi:hypothetical protein